MGVEIRPIVRSSLLAYPPHRFATADIGTRARVCVPALSLEVIDAGREVQPNDRVSRAMLQRPCRISITDNGREGSLKCLAAECRHCARHWMASQSLGNQNA